jgi:hypothetical protein
MGRCARLLLRLQSGKLLFDLSGKRRRVGLEKIAEES